MRGLWALVIWLAPNVAEASCAEELRLLVEGMREAGASYDQPRAEVVPTPDQRCRVDNVPVSGGGLILVNIGVLTWTPGEIGPAFREKVLPRSLKAEAQNIRFMVDLDEDNEAAPRGRAHMLGLPAANAAVAWEWLADERRLILERASVNWWSGDALSFTGIVEDVDLTSSSTTQMSATWFGFSEMHLAATIDDYMSENIADALDDALATDILRYVNAAPDPIFASGARNALRRVIADKDQLIGEIDIRIDAEPPIGPSRFLPLLMGRWSEMTPDEFWTLLDGVTVDVHYDPL